MSSTNDGEANFKRLASLPRTGTCVSVLAIVAAITAICISSTALWKLNYEHKKVRINDELWLQLKEALRNDSSIDHIADRARRGSTSTAVCSIMADTNYKVMRFRKDTAIGPMTMINSKGLICPNPRHRDTTACPTHLVPSDNSGITIRQTGWYFVYGSVSFSPITETTKLGWKIVACHLLKDRTKSQCDMTARNYWFSITAEREAPAGDPGTLYGGRIIRCRAGDVISIMPLYDNLKINMYDKTELGAFMIAPTY